MTQFDWAIFITLLVIWFSIFTGLTGFILGWGRYWESEEKEWIMLCLVGLVIFISASGLIFSSLYNALLNG